MSSDPIITPMEDLQNLVLDTPGLSCSQCGKAQEKESFSRCSKCHSTYYCSRECQVEHWPIHKSVCRARASAVAAEEQYKTTTLADGKTYVSPEPIRAWYQKNKSAIEHTAIHALEIYKGSSSLQSTHAVVITVELDRTHPDDPGLVRFLDCDRAPLNVAQNFSPVPATQLTQVTKDGFIILFFVDLKNNIKVIEFLEAPSAEPYLQGKKQPDEMWKVTAVVKLNTALPGMD
ncbi:hypothetical protein K435DRAFT_848446 [Dendrothele bispora CBS 962.96]|uniref:MYND-type domain-containing protein n=1 Tax=Dendrothele bispora (strain CBS 962.96) TaxID=1314807 RepID=A0A4S8MV25_DENBC|nr:hypothetical protein K435DRAFT_848446 [Dendrothele bispora CBS 962.96]